MVKRRGDSPTYVAIIFIFSLGILFAIYTSSGTQFQSIKGATTVTTVSQNAQISSAGVVGSSIQQSTTTYTTVITSATTTYTTTITTAVSNSNTLVCIFAPLPICEAVWAVECFFGVTIACTSPSTQIVNPNPAQGLSLSANAGSTSVSNNGVLKTLSDPFNQALIALGTFLGLGILAGLMGAGMLARVMVLAGLALSIILYIEGQLATFAGMPLFIWWLFNGIMTMMMIIIVHEAFSKGGLG